MNCTLVKLFVFIEWGFNKFKLIEEEKKDYKINSSRGSFYKLQVVPEEAREKAMMKQKNCETSRTELTDRRTRAQRPRSA